MCYAWRIRLRNCTYKATRTGIPTAMRAHTLVVFYETKALLELPKKENNHQLVRNGQCQQCAIAMTLQSRDESVCSELTYESIQRK